MTTTSPLDAPFTYFGGKQAIAPLVWQALGAIQNYSEPFFGSGAVLLGRPDWRPGLTETVNDLDGWIVNFWRAIQAAPDEVARWADWPVAETDLTARHAWLIQRRDELQERLLGDPAYFDAHVAGWWVWGICCWIGSSWCSGAGPWSAVDGRLGRHASARQGIKRQRPNLSCKMGINRQLPHLSDRGQGINRKRPHLGNRGQGINRQVPATEDRGEWIRDWFAALAARLRDVRVCAGNWDRILGPAPTVKLGTAGVFLDPPYGADRDGVYTTDSFTVARQVRDWAVAHGDDPRMRIVLCGYEGEHDLPPTWEKIAWKPQGGYANMGNGKGKANRRLERIWLSPHCHKTEQLRML